LPLNFVADECVHRKIVTTLREQGHAVNYIAESNRDVSDHEIIEIVTQQSAILVTEDSDFGEWVFVHGYNNVGVVFLRFNAEELDEINQSIIKIVNKYKQELFKKFIVITPTKFRIREI
jgi:predicted nuclease of predicted toxin-antitoxin system